MDEDAPMHDSNVENDTPIKFLPVVDAKNQAKTRKATAPKTKAAPPKGKNALKSKKKQPQVDVQKNKQATVSKAAAAADVAGAAQSASTTSTSESNNSDGDDSDDFSDDEDMER